MERMGRAALAATVASALVTLASIGASAAVDARSKCIAAKTKLVGEAVACLQKAAARRALTGKNTVCAAIKFRERWEAIEERPASSRTARCSGTAPTSRTLSDNCGDFVFGQAGLFVGNVGLGSSDGGEEVSSQWDGLVAECDGSNLPAPAHLICACGQR